MIPKSASPKTDSAKARNIQCEQFAFCGQPRGTQGLQTTTPCLVCFGWWLSDDLIATTLQLRPQFLETGCPKERRNPEHDEARQRILSVLDPKSDREQPAMSAQSPDTAPRKVILAAAAAETEPLGVAGKRGQRKTRVEVAESCSAGLCERSHGRSAALRCRLNVDSPTFAPPIGVRWNLQGLP